MLKIWRNRTLRGTLIQGLVLLGTVALFASFVLTARENLVSQGIATGFGFLERSTGWPINFSLIEVSDRSPYSRMLLAGFLNTIYVGLLGLAAATLTGLVVGMMRISSNLVLNILGTIFVETFRNVPLILQVIFWYALLTHLPPPRGAIDLAGVGFLSNRGLMLPAPALSAMDLAILALGLLGVLFSARRMGGTRSGLTWVLGLGALAALFTVLLLTGRAPDMPLVSIPELRGLRFVGGLTVKPEFAALLIAIMMFGGAYVAEIVRGGFLSVDRGRLEAAKALGLSSWQIMRFVHIPLAIRAMLPALTNQYIWLMKATTLGVAIGYPDYFMVVSTSINQSGQTIELLLLLMGGFLAINYVIGGIMNTINARLAIKGRS
ncbi:amino acid ABC transporter permease [Oceanibium sediminis]|uniref:amino acid ABC transporter permease n=1 Tax=Oceanibium sediminis TaxID=2026339 RepID=UPI000DD2E05D|nr:ABC transporter permease subunit [Oceanibium sediminis]